MVANIQLPGRGGALPFARRALELRMVANIRLPGRGGALPFARRALESENILLTWQGRGRFLLPPRLPSVFQYRAWQKTRQHVRHGIRRPRPPAFPSACFDKD